jgi:hypothetical protein
VLVLYESSSDQVQTPALDDLRQQIDAAREAGAHMVAIPPAFREDIPLEDALAFVRRPGRVEAAVVLGGIPSPGHYAKLYEALRDRNIRLINDPAQFERAMYVDLATQCLGDLTFDTHPARDSEELEQVLGRVSLPVQIRSGTPRSKSRDWSQCLAEDRDHAREIGQAILGSRWADDRPKVLVRSWCPIQSGEHDGRQYTREFRFIVFDGQVLEQGCYWKLDAPLAQLADDELRVASALAVEAQRRMDVPYLSVDLAQREDGQWIVIETWDAQFATARSISRTSLWFKLLRDCSRRPLSFASL